VIPQTFEASQNENNLVLEPVYNTNYNDVEQNNNVIIQHVSQEVANKGCHTRYEERYEKTCPDIMCILCNTSPVRVATQRTSKISISLEVLQRHFKKSMDDAAKSLNVSRSTLKRICRLNGIERWPRAQKNNDEQSPNPKKVHKINNKNVSRALTVSPLGEASCSSSNVTIRATYGDDIVKFPFSISCGLNDLKEKICLRLGVNISVKLKCKDEDGDLVLIACDDALHEFFGNRLSRSLDHNTLFDFSIFRDTNYNV
jgi:hypothetical protein